MDAKLTVRVDPVVKRALLERARLRKKSVSAVVRKILTEALAEKLLGERIGGLAGRLELPTVKSDAWRRHLRKMNWRS